MAQTSADLVAAALLVVYTALAADKTSEGAKAGVQSLQEVAGAFNKMYDVVDIALTADSDDAGVSEFVAAEATISVGTIYRTTVATYDFTDNAMATAKGSAVAVGDLYVVSGADAVVYLGNNDGIPFPMDAQTEADFG